MARMTGDLLIRASNTHSATHPANGLALLPLELRKNVYNHILFGDEKETPTVHVSLTREGRISMDNVKTMANLMAVNCWHRNDGGAHLDSTTFALDSNEETCRPIIAAFYQQVVQKVSFSITKIFIPELLDHQPLLPFHASDDFSRLSSLNAAFVVLTRYPHLKHLEVGLDITRFLREHWEFRGFVESAKSEITQLDTLFAQSVVTMIVSLRSRGIRVVVRWKDLLLKSCRDPKEFAMDLTDKLRAEFQNLCVRQIRRVGKGRKIAEQLGESVIEVVR